MYSSLVDTKPRNFCLDKISKGPHESKCNFSNGPFGITVFVVASLINLLITELTEIGQVKMIKTPADKLVIPLLVVFSRKEDDNTRKIFVNVVLCKS